jgi:hypothetical protein
MKFKFAVLLGKAGHKANSSTGNLVWLEGEAQEIAEDR